MKSKTIIALLIVILLYSAELFSASYVDTPNRGNLPHNVDKTSSLSELILRLEGDWIEKFTGKAYWIGYTDDMYSIAAYKEAAVDPLLDFIEKSTTEHARHGAFLTLHLIGIESKIAGRYYEEFTNKKAREALLSLLSLEQYQNEIIGLLIRDPWPSDIPYLFNVIKRNSPYGWKFIKALQRYDLKNAPVHQKIPQDIAVIGISQIKYATSEEYYKHITDELSKAGGTRFIIETDLLNSEFWKSNYHEGVIGGDFESILHHLTECGYIRFGDPIEYYVKNDRVCLCSIKTAKERWIEWYNKNKDLLNSPK